MSGPVFKTFTRRTDGAKLAWLKRQLTAAGIAWRQERESFHAPILEVDAARFDDAWAILTPVDEVPDDSPQFAGEEAQP